MKFVAEARFKKSVFINFESFLEFDIIGAYVETVKEQGLVPQTAIINILSEAEGYTKSAAEALLKKAFSIPHKVSRVH